MDCIEAINHFLSYEKETGILRWKVAAGSKRAGDVAGSSFDNGYGSTYTRVRVANKHYFAHRIAWLLSYGEWPAEYIDHVNHDGRDNRLSNLRLVDNERNQKNAKLGAANRSGISGVCMVSASGKWHAWISRNKKQAHIGSFSNLFDAACARKSAELRNGYHKNHGLAA